METQTTLESLHCTSCNAGSIEFSRSEFVSAHTLIRKVCPQCNAHVTIYQEFIHNKTFVGYVLL